MQVKPTAKAIDTAESALLRRAKAIAGWQKECKYAGDWGVLAEVRGAPHVALQYARRSAFKKDSASRIWFPRDPFATPETVKGIIGMWAALQRKAAKDAEQLSLLKDQGPAAPDPAQTVLVREGEGLDGGGSGRYA